MGGGGLLWVDSKQSNGKDIQDLAQKPESIRCDLTESKNRGHTRSVVVSLVFPESRMKS